MAGSEATRRTTLGADQWKELSHQMNGELHVRLGEEWLYKEAMPPEYLPGQAPRRPRAGKPKQPCIYTLGGRPAVAAR